MGKTVLLDSTTQNSWNFVHTFIDDHEIGMTILVDFTNASEKETNASVLKFQSNFFPLFFYEQSKLIYSADWLTMEVSHSKIKSIPSSRTEMIISFRSWISNWVIEFLTSSPITEINFPLAAECKAILRFYFLIERKTPVEHFWTVKKWQSCHLTLVRTWF